MTPEQATAEARKAELRPVYLVHGEVPSSEGLAAKLREHGASATVARPGLTIDLANLPALSRD